MSAAVAYLLCKHQLPPSDDSNATHTETNFNNGPCCLKDETKGSKPAMPKGISPRDIHVCQLPGVNSICSTRKGHYKSDESINSDDMCLFYHAII